MSTANPLTKTALKDTGPFSRQETKFNRRASNEYQQFPIRSIHIESNNEIVELEAIQRGNNLVESILKRRKNYEQAALNLQQSNLMEEEKESEEGIFRKRRQAMFRTLKQQQFDAI